MPLSAKFDWPDLMARHNRWLRAVVLARTGEPQAVDEVMQDLALAILRSTSGPSDASKVCPWLYRLAVRQALLYRRRLGRVRRLRNRLANRATAAGQNGHGRDPFVWLIHLEQSQIIRAALGRLPPRDAESLMLKYLEGWTYTEIADHLGLSRSAIVSRVNRARARLRSELSELKSRGDSRL